MSQPAPERPMTRLEIRKGPDAELRAGGLRFVACRREVDDIDGGITLIVWSEEGTDAASELLRFDLFRARPHYHAPAQKQEETAIDAGDAGAIAWGVEALAARAPDFVREAGRPDLAAALDQAALAGCGPALRALLDGLGEPHEVSTFEVDSAAVEALRRADDRPGSLA